MSHIASYKTKIRLNQLRRGASPEHDPTWRLLREAMEAAAEELGGSVVDVIYDYCGAPTDCDLGLVTDDFPRGIGVRVNPVTGEVAFIYDDYGGFKLKALRICEAIQQSYTTLALARALKELHYEVEMEEIREGQERAVVVRGVL
ncbi:MAG: hypothetical protein AB1331_05885 [Bacillota bacterium]